MAHRLGVDVGGTFTDLLLVDESDGSISITKVPSTPDDPSRGVLEGIRSVCERASIDPTSISHVMHGTTIATNVLLTGSGARVGLVTTRGFRQILQIARSFVPGGLGGWVIYQRADPIAPLELTIEAHERVSARGEIAESLDETGLREALRELKVRGIEALTVSLINAYCNDVHERRIREVAEEELQDIPVSLSSGVIPEMQEYERTLTTVANSYVRPAVERYLGNLEPELERRLGDVSLHILRSDGGLSSVAAAREVPVNTLMSGPAGGVAGAIWVARQAGFGNLITFDMGGTSTDVCLVQNGKAQLRRETTVGDFSVRASSLDVRSVGAGGGSIAHVPELTRALRVGPQSAGADPGPACYGRGGDAPTVTDANLVLGNLPESARLGGEMKLVRSLAERAVQQIADALDLSLERAAAGIIDIVNENMCGALRLVSVEQGHDPRDFALIAFGGAGPLHANALAGLLQSWPVIVPPGPGVLCAYGDATTRLRDEASRSFIRRFRDTSAEEVAQLLEALAAAAARALDAERVPRSEQSTEFQVDLRYHGQGLLLSVDVDLDGLRQRGFDAIGDRFDQMHQQLFTFALDADKEFVNLRAVAQGRPPALVTLEIPAGGSDPSTAAVGSQAVFMDGKQQDSTVYDRALLRAGNVLRGPAIVTEMDSTTLILAGHVGAVDGQGNILIHPED